MAISNPKDLFLYELSAMYDAEKKTGSWLNEISGKIRESKLQEIVRSEQQECQQATKKLESCFQAFGGRPQDVSCMITDGMKSQFQHFMSQQPSPEVMDMYTAGWMLQGAAFCIATYRGLMGKALGMGQVQCAQALDSILVSDLECAGRLERVSHEMGQRVMAAA